MLKTVRDEKNLILAAIMAVIGFTLDHAMHGASQALVLLLALVLVLAILMASIRVAHHAETLAHRLGDPYGTMILTLSAVGVEVLMLAIMLHGEHAPTLVRDTIYSAIMLDINGILGLAALLGGLKHGEQPYNDDSSKTYGVMILTAIGISMIVPEFIPEQKWMWYSGFTIFAMMALYALFLKMQVGAHSYFFSYAYPKLAREAEGADEPPASPMAAIFFLCSGIVLIGLLAEFMSSFLTAGLKTSGVPLTLMAILVATISAAPEILTALRAALKNRMQATINIAMGASLSTVILTVPAMEALALYQGTPLTMAMSPLQIVMIAITLIVAAINLNDGETNAIEGMTHFILFATFMMLTVLGL